MFKNYLIAVVGVVIFAVFAFFMVTTNNTKKNGYLRIHIRAHSNMQNDQDVKYKVKESVTDFLTELVIDCKNAADAMAIINANLKNIDCVANQTLLQNGFEYGAKSRLNEEYFPTRSYDSLLLENGLYDALIIDLGDAAGDNWWCVVYPPLCFGKVSNIQFKSIFKK